jgi:hypothetical protein
MGNILELHRKEKEIDQELVTCLRGLLKEAKEGELIGVSFYANRQTEYGSTAIFGDIGSSNEAIGALWRQIQRISTEGVYEMDLEPVGDGEE